MYNTEKPTSKNALIIKIKLFLILLCKTINSTLDLWEQKESYSTTIKNLRYAIKKIFFLTLLQVISFLTVFMNQPSLKWH